MRSVDLRTENRFRLIAGLRQHGACTRASLGNLTGLSAAAVSTLTSGLAADGIVESTRRQPLRAQRRGRPENVVELAPSAALALTLELTIDRLSLRLLRYDGSLLHRSDTSVDTHGCNADALVSLLVQRIDALLSKRKATQLHQISIGFQGTTSHESGMLVWSPILAARNVPIREALSRRFGVPVNVNNDCRLISQALHVRRYRELGSNFVTLLFSHGIGMALIIDDQAFAGVYSSAMEIGHLQHERGGALCRCGQRGCIEAYAADYGIVRHAEARDESSAPAGRVPPGRLQALADDARAGHAPAAGAFARAGTAVGQGLAMVFRLLDPMPVALVGHVTTGFDLMQAAMQHSLDTNFENGCSLDALAHRFDQEEELLQAGLALDALSSIDRRLATSELSPGLAPA